MDINTNENLNVNLSEDNLTRAKDLKLKESARKLESVFLQFMLKPMEEGMTKSMLGEESNTNLAKSMFSQVMADAMAKNNNIGLSETIYKHLKDLEEKQGKSLGELEKQTKTFLKIDRK